MATDIVVTFNTARVERNLRNLARRIPTMAKRAMQQEARIEMKESKRMVPVDFGDLRDSGRVLKPTRTAKVIEVVMKYGGVPAKRRGGMVHYAAAVHEDRRHAGWENVDGGLRGPGYLERAIAESFPFMPQRIANGIRAQLLAHGPSQVDVGLE